MTNRGIQAVIEMDLKGIRESAGLTQREAGGLVGMEEATWQHTEAGRRSMQPQRFELFVLKVAPLIEARRKLGL